MLEFMKGVSNEQLQILLDTIENTPAMAATSILDTRCNRFDENWEELMENLNAIPNGAMRGALTWKRTLKDWKALVKAQAQDENVTLDDLSKRLLRLVEQEQADGQAEFVPDDGLGRAMRVDMFPDQDTENIFRRPYPRRNRRRSTLMEELSTEYLLRSKDRCLKTLLEGNVQLSGLTRKQIMQMHLDRLHRVSQELENHIQDVQNRIQVIKDRWANECDD